MHLTRRALALAVISILPAISAPIEAAAQDIPFLYPFGDTLVQGQSLLAGQGLISQNGLYTLILHDDGNLVEYFKDNTTPTWATETDGIIVERHFADRRELCSVR